MINARGGSKGIPGKNIKLLMGKPLIAYSIEIALQVEKIDKVIVSTEDEKIANIAKEYGAEVPFMRPKELATSEALQVDTIIYNVEKLQQQGHNFETIVLLQPTAPLRSVEDVLGCLSLMEKENADTVITVTDVGSRHPTGIYRMQGDYKLQPFIEANKSGFNRQSLEKIYWRTGSVYVIKKEVLLKNRAIYGKKIMGYITSEERAFNMDTMFDWKLIEAWMQYQANQNNKNN